MRFAAADMAFNLWLNTCLPASPLTRQCWVAYVGYVFSSKQ